MFALGPAMEMVCGRIEVPLGSRSCCIESVAAWVCGASAGKFSTKIGIELPDGELRNSFWIIVLTSTRIEPIQFRLLAARSEAHNEETEFSLAHWRYYCWRSSALVGLGFAEFSPETIADITAIRIINIAVRPPYSRCHFGRGCDYFPSREYKDPRLESDGGDFSRLSRMGIPLANWCLLSTWHRRGWCFRAYTCVQLWGGCGCPTELHSPTPSSYGRNQGPSVVSHK